MEKIFEEFAAWRRRELHRSQVRVLPVAKAAAQWQSNLEPIIPAARNCAVVKAGVSSETESGRVYAAH
jgi:hypothetical protein